MKKALAIELQNIQLSSTQQIQLLEERTELEPNQVIKDLRCIQIELGPDIALDMVWDTFDKTYHTPHSPSQQLLQKLTQGPTINPTASALVSFSLHCRAAQKLFITNPHALPSLNEQGTLDTIANRLHNTLRLEWFTHRTTLSGRAEAPTFHDFVAWIEKRTTIARFDRNSRPNHINSTYAEVTMTPTTSALPQSPTKRSPL